jgi:uncharacterized protein
VNRRHFLKSSAVTAAAINLARAQANAASSPSPATAEKFVDTNVFLSRWPFRRLWGDEPSQLVAKLREHGVTNALAGSFDALFHKDISAVNVAVAADCAAHGKGILIPVGSINPTLPDWEEDLRRCHEVHGMRVIRVHPNYHRYQLDDACFTQLFDQVARRGMTLQIALVMEDERTQNALVQVPPVNPEPLVGLLTQHPTARVMLLNCFRGLRNNRFLLNRLNATRRITFDVSTLEVMGGIEELLGTHPDLRLVFGSYAPFYIFESAALKLTESVLTPEQLTAIKSGHAGQILGAS